MRAASFVVLREIRRIGPDPVPWDEYCHSSDSHLCFDSVCLVVRRDVQ